MADVRPSEKVLAYALHLCQTHVDEDGRRKCLTWKCPAAEYGCYDYPSFTEMYRATMPAKRKAIGRKMNDAMRKEGWVYEEQVQQQKDDN